MARYHVIDTTTGEVVHEAARHPYLVMRATYTAPRRPRRGKGSQIDRDLGLAAGLACLALLVLGLTV